MSKNLDYQLGIYVGEYILFKYLPTLSTDMILSNNIVKLSKSDTKKCELLDAKLKNSYSWGGNTSSTDDITSDCHKKWLQHQNKMANKYLPPILKCNVPKVYPKNLKKFKKGIINTLWNCDLCWYSLSKSDIEFIPTDDFAWASIINLKLKVK